MYFHIHEKVCSNSCSGNRVAVNTDGKFYPCIQFVGDRCIYKCSCARLITTNDIVEVSPLICETERIYIEEADNLANRLYKDFKNIFIALNY